MRSLMIFMPLVVAAIVACSHEDPPNTTSGGTGGQSIGTMGPGGSGVDGGSTGSVYYDSGSASAFPVIPPDCAAQPDAGLVPVVTEFTCPVDGAQVKNCANVPYTCYDSPPNPCPQPPPGQPYRYACLNSNCFQGCADIPCPDIPCPADKPSLWTCGPMKPDLADQCDYILVTDGTKPYANRYSVCCTF